MDLTELIMTRVSHDMAGMGGAIYNTAELLEIDPAFAAEAGPLLKDSTAGLLARLRLFRALFGLKTAVVTTDLMTQYLKTLSAPIVLKGQIQTRVALAATVICAETLIRGGTIFVKAADQDHLVVEAEGTLNVDPALEDILKGTPRTEATPKQAVIVWLKHLLDKDGQKIAVEKSDQMLKFTLG